MIFTRFTMLQKFSLFAAALLAVCVSAQAQTINIRTIAAQMKYDVEEFTVIPGAEVKLILENGDDLPHNLVIFAAGTDVLAVASKNMEKPEEALKRDWLPDSPAVLAHTKMAGPKTRDEVVFKAPMKAGLYPFACTFPGHTQSMQGKMKVGTAGPGLTGLKFAVYNGEWSKLPDFATLKPHREGDIADNLVQLKFDDYKNQFGVVYTGKLNAQRDAEYVFSIGADDGVRLLVEGNKVVELDGSHSVAEIKDGKIVLKTGEHDFRLEYFQGTGEAQIFVAWRGGDFAATPLSKWVPPTWGGELKKAKTDGGPKMPLIVGNEPVIYRNFISGAGNRGIGVGYPGGVNLAWSAEQLNLVMVWRGGFIDTARHWIDRGGGAQGPLGYDVFQPVSGLSQPFAVLSSTDEEWPRTNKQWADGYKWKGYKLDAKRYPTFLYEWEGVKVSDRYDVVGDTAKGEAKLIRTLRLDGKIPANAYLRLGFGASITPEGGGFLVSNGRLSLDKRDFQNAFRVAADGAQIGGHNLLIPARAEMKITYAWPTDTVKH